MYILEGKLKKNICGPSEQQTKLIMTAISDNERIFVRVYARIRCVGNIEYGIYAARKYGRRLVNATTISYPHTHFGMEPRRFFF